jgi:predicted RNase H-like HicB family nuclease
MLNYIAVIHKEQTSDFGVSFPDFPGCVTAGKTVDEAKDMAQEALEGHIAAMLDEGYSLPTPSSLEEVWQEDDYKQATVYFMVSIKLPKKEPVRFNASMDAELLFLVDAKASQFGMTRSGFLAEAARKELGLRGQL